MSPLHVDRCYPARHVTSGQNGTGRIVQPNTLYYGDNLDVLRQYIPDESVDLIYLDPPFNSNRRTAFFKDNQVMLRPLYPISGYTCMIQRPADAIIKIIGGHHSTSAP